MTFKKAKEFIVGGLARNHGQNDRLYRVLAVEYADGECWEDGFYPLKLTLEFYGLSSKDSFTPAKKRNVKTHTRKNEAARKFPGDVGTMGWYEPVYEDQSLKPAKQVYAYGSQAPGVAWPQPARY